MLALVGDLMLRQIHETNRPGMIFFHTNPGSLV